MTRDEAREAVKVLLHYADGGEVQVNYGSDWVAVSTPSFNFSAWRYRIKPSAAEGWGRFGRMVTRTRSLDTVPSNGRAMLAA